MVIIHRFCRSSVSCSLIVAVVTTWFPINAIAQQRPPPRIAQVPQQTVVQQPQRMIITLPQLQEQLEVGKLPSTMWKIEGGQFSNTAIRPQDSNISTLQIQDDIFFAFRTDTGPTRGISSEYQVITPIRILGINDQRERELVSISYDVRENGIRFDNAEGVFKGEMRIWLEVVGNPSANHRFTQPIIVDISPAPGEVKPTQATLESTGLINAQKIDISAGAPGESITMILRPARSQFEIAVFSIRALPGLKVTIAPRIIRAFGLQKAKITVELKGDVGTEDHIINVNPTKVEPPDSFVLREGGDNASRVVDITSGTNGTDRIEVSSPKLHSVMITIKYKLPVLFFIVAIFGGLIGSAIRYKDKSKDESLMWVFGGGVGWALVVAVAWAALGIDMLNIGLPPVLNIGGVFVVASIAGSKGPRGEVK